MSGKVIIAGTIGLIAAIAASALYLGLFKERPPQLTRGALNIADRQIEPRFSLISETGQRVTEAEIIDRPVLVYFGFTNCPDICPIDLPNMADAADILAEQGVEVRPVMITVDPERDTPEVLADYTDNLHPGMIGLTGTVEEVRAAAATFQTQFRRIETPNSALVYTIQHFGFIYYLTPDGGLRAQFEQGTSPQNIATEILRVTNR